MSEAKVGGRERRGRRRAAGLRKHQSIENVVVEESFAMLSSSKEKVGDGVYVSATTSSNKRFYGVLVDQPALKEATSMWLQDQSDSLELNRRIRALTQKKQDEIQRQSADLQAAMHKSNAGNACETISKESAGYEQTAIANKALTTASGMDTSEETARAKRPLAEGEKMDSEIKRFKAGEVSDTAWAKKETATSQEYNDQSVQKFKYVQGKRQLSAKGEMVEDPGYRVLVATFCNVEEAAGGNEKKTKAIKEACEEGGNFLPDDTTSYYQYEVLPSALGCHSSKSVDNDLRTSMGFHSFLQDTPLPPWFPLSNLQVRPSKVLNMLNLKRDQNGNISWENKPDNHSSADGAAVTLAGGTKLSMQSRSKQHYKIGVIGGGIAGVACCRELMALFGKSGIDAHVTLFEARSRLGGRIWTDRTAFSDENSNVSIELGASWIHGIDDNPLAALAQEAGINFITASEEVKMLGKDSRNIDAKMDEATGQLFDDLLDHAADDCWSAPENISASTQTHGQDPQAAVRWYASVFAQKQDSEMQTKAPPRIGTPFHRRSSDRSIDVEIGKAILKHKLSEVSKLSIDEHRMLMWNTKNIEYALGANISDLSMKYWDADERHAFEGDHVLLKQGYSRVIEYMMENLRKSGAEKFDLLTEFPVGKIEYARKSTTQPYVQGGPGHRVKMVDLSDTCSVTSQDGKHTKYFDFIVCACPLGVLKESISREKDDGSMDRLSFQPPLPYSKVDAISNVGFGLLNKVYLRFPKPFWRRDGLFKESDQCLFGNVSGIHPHHYMFFDIGRCLGSGENAPPILMSLISGREAVSCEHLSDKEQVDEVVTTLRTIFSKEHVPEPTAFRITRWGQDKYSRGSYTFLPPGATDQDFQLLQSPINGNGDSLILEGSETMRLFFAGEHTTALHPSMAHGAMLSGMRAAKEILSAIQLSKTNERDIDRVIPVALFRRKNPASELRCSLCHKVGGQVREGSLFAFKKGARQVLVHNNCAEYSPEVEVVDFKWKNVIRAVNRGKLLNCNLCKQSGATIGCTAENCFRIFHFSCAEDAGWRFERDGKVFYCDLHRKLAPNYVAHCDRVSINYCLTKAPQAFVKCHLCHVPDAEDVLGPYMGYQYGKRLVCLHEKCIKYSTICDIAEVEDSRMGHEYKNVFRVLDESRVCSMCSKPGATIKCIEPSCSKIYHLQCAMNEDWNFDKRGKFFICKDHRVTKHRTSKKPSQEESASTLENGGLTKAKDTIPALFQHNLLAQFGASSIAPTKASIPGNLDIGGTSIPPATSTSLEDPEVMSDSDESFSQDLGLEIEKLLDLPLSGSTTGVKDVVRLRRTSRNDAWGISFKVIVSDHATMLVVAEVGKTCDSTIDLSVGDVIVTVNGNPVGGGELRTLRDIMTSYLKDEVEVMMEIVKPENPTHQP